MKMREVEKGEAMVTRSDDGEREDDDDDDEEQQSVAKAAAHKEAIRPSLFFILH